MLQQTTQRTEETNDPPLLFPLTDGNQDSIGEGKRLDIKEQALTKLHLYSQNLKFISENLEQISTLKKELGSFEKGSKDYKLTLTFLNDALMSIDQLCYEMGTFIPDSGYSDVSKGKDIAGISNTDIILILHEKLHGKEADELLKLVKVIRDKKSEEISTDDVKKIDSIVAAFKPIHNTALSNFSDFLIKKIEIREARREGDPDKATTLIEDEINKNLPGPRSSIFNSAQDIAERITGRDSHPHVDIQYSVTSDILNQKYDSIFSINGRQRNLPLEPQKEDKLKSLKNLLWDRNTNWNIEGIDNSEITNIEMCYATLKRLRTLLSSLKCTLEEIEVLKPELRTTKRKDAIDQFLKLFSETSSLVEDKEMSRSLKALSSISVNDLCPGNTLNSSDLTFKAAIDLTSSAFDIVSEELTSMNASPDKVNTKFTEFINENSSHPDIDKIKMWCNRFYERFKGTGIDRPYSPH